MRGPGGQRCIGVAVRCPLGGVGCVREGVCQMVGCGGVGCARHRCERYGKDVAQRRATTRTRGRLHPTFRCQGQRQRVHRVEYGPVLTPLDHILQVGDWVACMLYLGVRKSDDYPVRRFATARIAQSEASVLHNDIL